MSISVKNIVKIYGEQKALNNVSFEVHSGEIVGFLGPNGAGKSTMMKILTTYIPQTEGTAHVCGINVSQDPIAVKKMIGYLPEHNPLYLEMFVREYLSFVAGLHQLDNKKSRIDAIIEQVGLTLEQNKLIGALSKGYRQRVGLAQAMIHDPSVLILDEPTTGLDPNQIVDIRNLIKEIGKEKTVMMSTHIMQEVEAVCDRAIIINKGEIAMDGKVQDMKGASAEFQLVKVEFSSGVSEKELLAIQEVVSVSQVATNSWLVKSSGKNDVRPSLVKFASEKNVDVLTLQKEEQSMEQVFKNLTKSN